MITKILSKRVLLVIVFAGFILFAAFLFNFIQKNSTYGNSVPLTENIGPSVRIKIPVIGIDADVIPIGLTSDGVMDVPKDPAEAGWFNLGPRPGENGSAVIAGHYGWKNKTPAVFDNLHKLRIGDKLTVEDEKGLTTTFVVREIRIYDKDIIAPEVFSSSDGKAHLNLITCTGDWNKSEESFSDRLVVFTDKE